METETPTQPVEASSQPDRSLVAPAVERLAATRESLTEVANWMHGHWPEGIRPPYQNPVRISRHVTPLPELLAARRALDALDRPVVVTIQDATDDLGGYGYATVALPGVDVVIQADLDRWIEAFPGDLCARDGHLRGPLVEHVPEGAAQLCERCGGEFVWSGDTVTEVRS